MSSSRSRRPHDRPRRRPSRRWSVAATLLLVGACGTDVRPSPDRAPRAVRPPRRRSPCSRPPRSPRRSPRSAPTSRPPSGSTVTFNFGSSATLATQINAGAPADVFAAASPATMKTVTDAGGAGAPVDFVVEHAADRRAEGQPGPDHRPGRLRRRGQDDRDLRAAGALRSRGGEGVRGRQDHPEARHPGTGRQGDAGQGGRRRGGCGAGLPDRRASRRPTTSRASTSPSRPRPSTPTRSPC